MDFQITSDSELESAARDKTSYSATVDEVPGGHDDGQMQGLIDDAKRTLYIKTESDVWYDDIAYGHALVAMTAMKMKEAVENVNIRSYGIGDEQITFSNANPETSQQITSWSNEVNEGLVESKAIFEDSSPSFSNTASYIG